MPPNGVSPGVSGNLLDSFKGIAQMEERGMGAHAGVFGTTSGAGAPNIPGDIGGEPISYMYFDGYSNRSEGYRVQPGTTDTEHQEFTMIFDLFVPASNNSAHLSFFNGNDDNRNDADYLLTPSSCGVEVSSTAPPCLSEEKTGLLPWIRATVGNYGLPWLLAKFTHWPSPTGNCLRVPAAGKYTVTSNPEDRSGLFKAEEASITNREMRLLLIALSP